MFDFGPLLERDWIPDWLIRRGIRRLLATRLDEQRRQSPADRERFIESLRTSPVALRSDAANAQHYEVPAEFYRLVLGPHLKYSCALWEEGTKKLGQAEEAMLRLTSERAELADGQEILELGCGWGSLSLWMAAQYPASRILAVSNSNSQRQFIVTQAAKRRLANLTVVTADMNDFATDRQFDRVVSVEMFEHMRNYPELLRRISTWLKPDGRLFVHIFTHREFAYPFEVRDKGDWMAQHFFTGGMMPSDGLLARFADHLEIRNHWLVNGLHYWRTCEAWLALLDQNRRVVPSLFPEGAAVRQIVRWRVFFMACGELFRYRGGEEWLVSHYLLSKRASRPGLSGPCV